MAFHNFFSLLLALFVLVPPSIRAAPAAGETVITAAMLEAAYHRALHSSDDATALVLAHQLRAAEPGRAAEWTVEIARIHYQQKRYSLSLSSLREPLAEDWSAVPLQGLRLAALSHGRLGQHREALPLWTHLWSKSPTPGHAAGLAECQIKLNESAKAMAIIDAGLQLEGIEEAKVPQPRPNYNEKAFYPDIPAAAALHYLRAQAIERAEPQATSQMMLEYSRAVVHAPGFVAAKARLRALQSHLQKQSTREAETAAPLRPAEKADRPEK
ncbi:MAG TPA: hypothetical protein VJ952_06415 [Opitutales bacterium]|nr:hypothetical protein [Opitutales bacterium]